MRVAVISSVYSLLRRKYPMLGLHHFKKLVAFLGNAHLHNSRNYLRNCARLNFGADSSFLSLLRVIFSLIGIRPIKMLATQGHEEKLGFTYLDHIHDVDQSRGIECLFIEIDNVGATPR